MKKVIISILSFSLLLSFCNLQVINVHAQTNNYLSKPTSEEISYLEELERIQNFLFISGNEALENISDESHKHDLSKNLIYIKTQIKDLRIKLNDYHQKESLDIDKNPISLGFLNTLNYYSMALSALEGFVSTKDISDKNRYLENYFFAKVSATQTIDWVKDALGYND